MESVSEHTRVYRASEKWKAYMRSYAKAYRESPEGAAYRKAYGQRQYVKAKAKIYRRMPESRASRARNRASNKCKATTERYLATPKYKAGRAAYMKSPKGRAAVAKYRSTPEAKKVMDAGRKLYMSNPINRARMKDVAARRWRSPEGKVGYLRRYLLNKFGLSMNDYNKMVSEQNGMCAICEKPPINGRRLSVDHDHRTLRVRALLCLQCNAGLGNFRDKILTVYKAADYLEMHNRMSPV